MRKLLATLFIIGSLVALALPVIAQTGNEISVNTINDDDFPQLQLLLTVTDDQDKPVLGLTEPDFEVLFDGEPVQIVSVEEIRNADLGVSVVLVLDSSESMYSRPLEDTKTAANVLIDSLRPQDELAIVNFDSTVQVIQDFSNDFEAARGVIAGLTADGETALYEATYRGVEQALTTDNPRRVVIVVTDGHEYGDNSTVDAQAAVTLAVENNVPMYPVGFGYVYEPYLRGLAENTEGQAFILPDSERLPEIFDFIANYLRSQYIVTVEPAVEPDGGSYEVAVRIGEGQSAPYAYTTPDLYPTVTLGEVPAEAISSPVEVAVNATASRGISDVTTSIDGAVVEPVTGEGSATTFSANVLLDPYALTPGDHTLSANAVDMQGGSRSVEAGFVVASLPVEFSADLPADTVISEATRDVTVDVTQSQGAVDSVAFSVDGGDPTVVNAAPYTYTIDSLALGEGPHTLDITTSTAFGITTTQSFGFSIDPILFVTPTAIPTNTPVPTETPVPPTATEVPPTETPVPPTATEVPPTETPVPPTATEVPPTEMPEPTDVPAPYSFTISGLEAGAILTEPTTVTVEAGADEPAIKSVGFAVDGETTAEVSAAPFTFTLDPADFDAGDYELGILVTGENDNTGSQTVPFTIPMESAMVSTPTETEAEATEATEPQATESAPTETEEPAATDTSAPYGFTVNGLEPGAVLSDPTTTVDVEPDADQPDVDSITFTLNGDAADELDAEPFTFEMDNVALGNGEHELGITVNGADGTSGTQAIPFTVAIEPTDMPPAPVEFEVSGLQAGDVLDVPSTTVDVLPADDQAVASVTFTLDGEEVETVTEPPYQITLDNLALGAGDHELGITVEREDGETGTETLGFSIADSLFEDTTPPTAIGEGTSTRNDLLLIGGGLLLFLLLLAVWLLRRRNQE